MSILAPIVKVASLLYGATRKSEPTTAPETQSPAMVAYPSLQSNPAAYGQSTQGASNVRVSGGGSGAYNGYTWTDRTNPSAQSTVEVIPAPTPEAAPRVAPTPAGGGNDSASQGALGELDLSNPLVVAGGLLLFALAVSE